MSSLFETFLPNFDGFPEKVTDTLITMKDSGKTIQVDWDNLKSDEEQILNDLRNLIKEGKEVDEELFLRRAQGVLKRRESIVTAMEQQAQHARDAYEQLDNRIISLDKQLSYQFGDSKGEPTTSGSSKQPRDKNLTESIMAVITGASPASDYALAMALGNNKKRKSDHLGASSEVDTALLSGGNSREPVYCTCRRISFGQMVACENVDCAVEWFHFDCVGLTQSPSDPWFCQDCSAKLGLPYVTNTPAATAVKSEVEIIDL